MASTAHPSKNWLFRGALTAIAILLPILVVSAIIDSSLTKGIGIAIALACVLLCSTPGK